VTRRPRNPRRAYDHDGREIPPATVGNHLAHGLRTVAASCDDCQHEAVVVRQRRCLDAPWVRSSESLAPTEETATAPNLMRANGHANPCGPFPRARSAAAGPVWGAWLTAAARISAALGRTDMGVVHLFASLLGGLGTLVVFSPSRWPLALLCAALGGSALALVVAVAVIVADSVPTGRSRHRHLTPP
jgi:hypothetical protein